MPALCHGVSDTQLHRCVRPSVRPFRATLCKLIFRGLVCLLNCTKSFNEWRTHTHTMWLCHQPEKCSSVHSFEIVRRVQPECRGRRLVCWFLSHSQLSWLVFIEHYLSSFKCMLLTIPPWYNLSCWHGVKLLQPTFLTIMTRKRAGDKPENADRPPDSHPP